MSDQRKLTAQRSDRPSTDGVVEFVRQHYGLEPEPWQREMLNQWFGGKRTALVGRDNRRGKRTVREWLAAYLGDHFRSSD